MPAKTIKVNILKNDKVNETIYKMVVPHGGNKPVPGQFYMLKGIGAGFPLLGRPISVNDADDENVTFLYAVVGKGTEIFKKMHVGDELEITGPLGHGFDVELGGKIALVSGGIGFAPLVYVAKSLKNAEKIDFYCGFGDTSYELDSVKDYVNEIFVATDSGKEGHHGFVTEMIDLKAYDYVLTCGPEPMMVVLAKMCHEAGTQCYVSLESHMACGVGACLGCSCHTLHGSRCVCKDGPVFDSKEVVF